MNHPIKNNYINNNNNFFACPIFVKTSTMIHNISGKWKFSEEFECGIDKGFAFFIQNDAEINGYLEYEESIEDDEPFMVRQDISGSIHDNRISLKGEKATDPNGYPIADYNLDILEGTLTHEGKIVGHSYDSEDICGIFVLVKEE